LGSLEMINMSMSKTGWLLPPFLLLSGAAMTQDGLVRDFPVARAYAAGVTRPDAIKWNAPKGRPPRSSEMAVLYGGLDEPSPYLVFIKWYPGYMSAPHTYVTNRLSLVLPGT
jgi:hypothetical protein